MFLWRVVPRVADVTEHVQGPTSALLVGSWNKSRWTGYGRCNKGKCQLLCDFDPLPDDGVLWHRDISCSRLGFYTDNTFWGINLVVFLAFSFNILSFQACDSTLQLPAENRCDRTKWEKRICAPCIPPWVNKAGNNENNSSNELRLSPRPPGCQSLR